MRARLLLATLLSAALALAGTAPGGAVQVTPDDGSVAAGERVSAVAAPSALERRRRARRGLEVRVVRPRGARVTVVVRGPHGFRRKIHRTKVFRHARPGRYRVRARVARIFDQRVRPRVRPRHAVRVVRHRRGRRDGKTITVRYRKPAFCSRTGSRVYAWGEGDHGRLGRRARSDRARPRRVADLRGVRQVLGGMRTSYARCRNGTVWAWGFNQNGELGNGRRGDRSFPVQVRRLRNITQIASRDNGGLALRADGTVWAWGHGAYGQLGNGEPYGYATVARRPVPVDGLSSVKEIAAAGYTSYALLEDGTVWAWGHGGVGQLGQGSGGPTMSNVPVRVTGLGSVAHIAAGHGTAYALRTDGSLWAWGDGGQGQLGNGTTAHGFVPVRVSFPALTTIRNIGAGYATGFAIDTTGTLWSWGSRREGGLGDGTVDNNWVATPQHVPGLTSVHKVTGYGYGGYAELGDDTVWAWGGNDAGQLGIGTRTDTGTPTRITSVRGLRDVGAGLTNGYAIKR